MEASFAFVILLALIAVITAICVRNCSGIVPTPASTSPLRTTPLAAVPIPLSVTDTSRRCLIVGSGDAACSLARAIRAKYATRFTIVGCIDSDDAPTCPEALLARLGSLDELEGLIERLKIDEVLVAIPFAPPEIVACVERCCAAQQRSVVWRVIPGALEYVGRSAFAIEQNPALYERVLGRKSIPLDAVASRTHIENRVVLVTGAGGSIGSEICRQLVALRPARIVLLGHGENSLFAIRNELAADFDFDRSVIALADITDVERIRETFRKWRPQLVFHAAAHKHVPITEANVAETCRNNVLGTNNVAMAAAAFGAEKFVMVSTDKAIEPTSVLGATKRFAELICQALKDRSGTEFVSVRFGNVLGSRGSVVPVFLEQIRRGGPVKITHRDMQRYFMTIPEAASLIVGTATIARDGQVCILNMGEPLRILTLAERLIELSGFVPYRDIAIEETGIRPGEKLAEHLFTADEHASAIRYERFSLASQKRVPYETLACEIESMAASIALGHDETLLAQLARVATLARPQLATPLTRRSVAIVAS